MRLLAELLYLQEQHGDSAMSSTGSMIKNYFSGELLEQKKSSGSLQSKLQTIFKSVEENLSRQYTIAAPIPAVRVCPWDPS